MENLFLSPLGLLRDLLHPKVEERIERLLIKKRRGE